MPNMIKHKHRGAITKDEVIFSFKSKGFSIENYSEENGKITVEVTKDYSSSFNIEFNGLIKLKALIAISLYKYFSIITYPTFYEISNLIPKKAMYHVNYDGSLCYAPPRRPLDEEWTFINFVNAVDSLIYNYFCIEYIGKGSLQELEHGNTGLKQYDYIKNSINNK